MRPIVLDRTFFRRAGIVLAILALVAGIFWKANDVWQRYSDSAEVGASPSVVASARPSGTVVPESSPAIADGHSPSTSPSTAVTAAWATTTYRKLFAGSVPPAPKLTAIRTGSHTQDGYDRIAFDFQQDSAPGYSLHFTDKVVRDGSGEQVVMPGGTYLQIMFNPADAHDAAGNTTVKNPPIKPITLNYDELWSYVMNGDFEGHISVALGLATKTGYRVGEVAHDGYWTVYVDVKLP